MPQQQSHNTDAQQPGGEYFYSALPSFDLLSPMETVWNPWCMALGHYCPPQPRGIIMDVPICPYARPTLHTYLDPIVCYGPPLEAPSEVMNGYPDPWPQPDQPGQEYFSPYGPPPPHPPPMPMSFWQPPPPSPPVHYPPFGPEDMIPGSRQPGWFLDGLPPCPNAASALRTIHWVIDCSYQRPHDPAESPVTPGALTAPGAPRSPGNGPSPLSFGQPDKPEDAHRPSSPLTVSNADVTGPDGCEVKVRRHSWA
ncbi:hypothetical protein INS49_003609 [Diaporthe citri]|uniref:uncharacterized protein n=1 Tax=Diaporthe citri TaxID=83186 RepID=UPI001C7FCA11|nr:uncharacterized protein INS49_003609 [Diaporthe citri]KAG6355647.1 hypothetical protein INS49_003609 [Diaporthe citri]